MDDLENQRRGVKRQAPSDEDNTDTLVDVSSIDSPPSSPQPRDYRLSPAIHTPGSPDSRETSPGFPGHLTSRQIKSPTHPPSSPM